MYFLFTFDGRGSNKGIVKRCICVWGSGWSVEVEARMQQGENLEWQGHHPDVPDGIFRATSDSLGLTSTSAVVYS
jgi:hypothetical protein